MIAVHEKYLVDGRGRRKAAVVPLAEWARIVEALEDLDDIRAYDAAAAYPSEAVPFEQAVLEIREGTVG